MAAPGYKKQAQSPEQALRGLVEDISQGNALPVYLFIGEMAVTAPHVDTLASALVPEGCEEMNVQELDDDDAAPGRCVEYLETRGFFPGRKVLLVREPAFLHTASTAGARWKRVASLVEKKDYDRAVTAVSRLLGQLDLGVSELLSLDSSHFEKAVELPSSLSSDSLMKFMREYHDRIEPDPGTGGDDAEILLRWLEKRAKPEKSVLVIQASQVDRRTALFKAFKKVGAVLDFSPASDARSAKQQACAMVRSCLAGLGADIEQGALELLLELVGETNMTGLVREAEKLAALAGASLSGASGRKAAVKVRLAHVKEGVARQREEELYRLTGAIGQGDTEGALESLHRLLEQDIHPLALLGTVNNALKKMAAISGAAAWAFPEGAPPKVSYNRFRNSILPRLREFYKDAPEGEALLKGHPYGLYRQYSHALRFGAAVLLEFLSQIAETDLELKGGACDARLVLEMLVLNMTSAGGNKRYG